MSSAYLSFASMLQSLGAMREEKRNRTMTRMRRYPKEEFARRGDAIYEKEIPPNRR